MARPRIRRGKIEHLQFNMTPMIDIVFLLIVFFMLVSSFASVEVADLILPDPETSQGRSTRLSDKVVLNLQYTPGIDEPTVRLGPFVIPSNEELTARLQSTKRANPKVQLVLRADREVPYRYVRSAMDAVAESNIEMVNIGVQTER